MKPVVGPLIGVFMILLSLSLPAQADGNYLLKRCQAALDFPESRQDGLRAPMAYCYGLLQGIRELNRLYERKGTDLAYFCTGGRRLDHQEAAQLVVDYLRARPDQLYRGESVLAVQAFRQAFPCG